MNSWQNLCSLVLLISFYPALITLDVNQLLNNAYEHTQSYEYDQALAIYQELAQQYPTAGDLLCNIGFILKRQNKMIEAIAAYEKARPLVSSKATIERGIAHARLALGDFVRGWPGYEYRWVNPPLYNQELRSYVEKGGSLHNKIVLLHTEFGLGDILQFIRYAQELKKMGAHVIVESTKTLIPLLSLCPYIDEIIPPGAATTYHFQALIMSMPLILNTTLQTVPTHIPYLYADPTLTHHWQQKLAHDTKFKIGICWQADIHLDSANSTVKMDAKAKSIALDLLAQLSLLPNVSLYSLQKINGLDQLKNLPSHYIVHDFGDECDTEHGPFMDTAAIIKNVDLVITIDTSIAHLAGGLGAQVWLILPQAADWRWLLDCTDTPWYPNMRLFRQQQQGTWQPVITTIIHELTHMQLINKG